MINLSPLSGLWRERRISCVGRLEKGAGYSSYFGIVVDRLCMYAGRCTYVILKRMIGDDCVSGYS
jgi:hypothetical protein